ncbi:helix-turn-helix domain-containing protein [Lacticaseibacillus daqingensis]|uniref:helix-turn-helix domain-containing protein n=1 Tax=Lacticaseibacillus daqingensis TaxID=2486014 RepID=UPI000F76B6AE|nr:helix-turn-helix transcriptional regulator [Lacticaseibacillus daqingensis]
MGLNLASTIRAQRKARGVTQQQLADFLGVSKASVSKWETGATLPDITLLPLLAGYFNLTLDALMAYQASLSASAIRTQYQTLQAAFAHDSAEVVQAQIEATVRRYYACPPLLVAMAQLVINHYDLLPGPDQPTKLTRYLTQADTWLTRARTLSQDPVLIDKAAKLSAYCALSLQDPDRVLDLLGPVPQEMLPGDSLIAMAYQLKQNPAKAIEVTQSALYQQVAVMLSQLTNYLALLDSGDPRFTATVARGQALIAAFDLPQLNPLVTLNFLGVATLGWAAHQAVDRVVPLALAYLDLLGTLRPPLTLHGDAYFDQIDDWIAQSSLGETLPRDPARVKRDLWRLIDAHPLMAALRPLPAYQPVVARLATLKETMTDDQ